MINEKIQNSHLMYRGFMRPGYQPTASKLKGKSDNNLRESEAKSNSILRGLKAKIGGHPASHGTAHRPSLK
jgi:hypothetical protein